MARTDIEKEFPGQDKMIQSMKDLLPIIKPYIKAKDLAKCKESKSLVDLFPVFMQLVTDSLRTPVTGFQLKYDKKYYVKISCFHDIHAQTAYLMSIGFLPFLKKRNKILYDMVMEILKLLTHEKQVSCLEDDMYGYFGEEALSERCEYNTEQYDNNELQEMKDQLEEIRKYTQPYYKMLNEKSTGNIDKLLKMLKNYKPKLPVEKILVKWIRMGIKVYNEPGDMNIYSNLAIKQYIKENEIEVSADGEPDFDNGYPVDPRRTMKFIWHDDEDSIQAECQTLGEEAGNSGEAVFSIEYDCRYAKDLRNSRKEFLKDVGYMPEYLAQLFEYGMQNIEMIQAYSRNKLIANL